MTRCDLSGMSVLPGLHLFARRDDFEPSLKPLPDGHGSVAACRPVLLALSVSFSLLLAGCNERVKADPKLEAPPPAKVEHELDASLVKVDHPEQFKLVTAIKHVAVPDLNVTGTVAADVSRAVPVISLASGRIVEVHARLGDTVTKGQLMMSSKPRHPQLSPITGKPLPTALARRNRSSQILFDKEP